MYRRSPYIVVPWARHSFRSFSISSTLSRVDAVRMCSASHLACLVLSILYSLAACNAAFWAFALQVS